MRSSLRRLGALGLSAFVASAFVAGSASADTPEVFLGQATGQALHLNVLGVEATLGQSLAHVQSTLLAEANGAGDLAVVASKSAAKVTENGTSIDDPNKCATPALPDAVTAVLSAGLGCSSSSASITGGSPVAHSEGSVASIDLSANTVLKQATDALPIGDVLDQVLNPVLDAVNAVTNQPPVNIDAKSTVSDLLTALTTTKTLSIKLGSSTSDVTSTAGTITSTATDAAGQIDILPVGALNNTPIASIIIGSAKSTVVYDRKSGKAVPSFDPAIVTVKLASFAGVPASTISIAPGTSQTLFANTPLETTIAVASGSTFVDANNATHAVADGVSINLFKGLGIDLGSTLGLTNAASTAAVPALGLQLAHAEALGGGALPTTTVSPTPEVVRDLPRTGGTPWLPVVGGTMAFIAILTRRYALSR